MRYYKYMYLGESVKKRSRKILRRLEGQKSLLGIYLIVFPENGNNQLEFFDAVMLEQKDPEKLESLFVAGIAGSYEEAVDMIQEMTEEVYKATGTGNLRRYITDKQNR